MERYELWVTVAMDMYDGRCMFIKIKIPKHFHSIKDAELENSLYNISIQQEKCKEPLFYIYRNDGELKGTVSWKESNKYKVYELKKTAMGKVVLDIETDCILLSAMSFANLLKNCNPEYSTENNFKSFFDIIGYEVLKN